ncbi:MAG TPA: NAD(P)H-binding protein [Pseudonocardia sp.]|jgi:uncharacterized protein YbjT (DUF2867 family)
MKVIVFGATGMVGQGVLRECLEDDRVRSVLVIGRRSVGLTHSKLTELVRSDLDDLDPIADQLTGYDATFFCLGVSSVGMTESEYRRVTYELTLAVAGTIAGVSPGSIFVYVSGQGTDSSERGRVRWARVKGATENALRGLPLRCYFFRPGFIRPMHGVRSKTRVYAVVYAVVRPLYPLLRRLTPGWATTSEAVARAMIALADPRTPDPATPNHVLENRQINALAGQ